MINGVKNGEAPKNFGLSKTEFNNLCQELRSGDETLFELTFLSHFKQSTSYLIRKIGASYDDAYDVVMDVMIEFRKRILDNKVEYGNLRFLFTQMCVQRYKREKVSKFDREDYAYVNQYEYTNIDEEVFLLLDKCMSKLGEQCQKIIEDIYYSKMSYKALENKYQTSASNLRKRKERCMSKLKMNLQGQLNIEYFE